MFSLVFPRGARERALVVKKYPTVFISMRAQRSLIEKIYTGI